MGNNGTWDGLSEGAATLEPMNTGFLGAAPQGGRGSYKPQKDLEEVGGGPVGQALANIKL